MSVSYFSCDRSIAHAATPPAPAVNAASGMPSHPRLILATTVLASSLAFIDGSIVNVGLPAIGKSFGADGESLAWVVNGYLLPLSALLLTGGAAGDRFGRRRMLLLGIALFAAASALCAMAPTLGWLIASRVLQGAAAAMLMPNSLAILGASFTGEARGRAIGTWAAFGAAAGAIGPLLGGWLIDLAGWRSMFLVNLPIAAAAFWLGMRYVRDQADEKRPTLDLVGAALATAGLASLTWGLTVASARGGLSASSTASVAAGAALLIVFVWTQRQRGDQAMMPLALFASSRFIGLTVFTFLLYGALGGLLVLLPYVLIKAHGYSATAAGAALLPLPLVIALTAPTMGRLAEKHGAGLLLTLGSLVVAAGFLLAMRIGAAYAYWTSTLPAMLLISLGMAGAVAPLTTAVLSSIEPRHTGVASGLNSAVARTGGLLATALLGRVLASTGAALEALFHQAMLIGAGMAIAASVSAWVWLRRPAMQPVKDKV